jgi:hypothetical protein
MPEFEDLQMLVGFDEVRCAGTNRVGMLGSETRLPPFT